MSGQAAPIASRAKTARNGVARLLNECSTGQGAARRMCVGPARQERAVGSCLPDRPTAVRGVLDQFKLWPVNAPITVCFNAGDQDLRRLFVETSLKWSAGTSLKFDFGSALQSFVASRDEFDLWFKAQMLAVTGVDLNNPPEGLAPAELLSHYEAAAAAV